MGSKIIFTTPILHYPTMGGPTLRIHTSLLALSRVAEVHLIVRIPLQNIGGDSAVDFYSSIVKKFLFSPSVKVTSSLFVRIVRKLLKLFPKSLNIFLKRFFKIGFNLVDSIKVSDADFIIEYAKKNAIDIIWCGYGNISYKLMKRIKAKAPWIKVVCDTDSVWSRFILRGLPYERDLLKQQEILSSGSQKEKEESDWVRFCEVTTAVSEIDAEYYQQLLPDCDAEKIKLFSNVIELDFYKEKLNKNKRVTSPCIYLAGTFQKNSPMEKAARWFVNEVFPLIKFDIPDITLNIVGNNSDTVLSDIKDQSIKIFGRVDNIMNFLPYAEVALVPLFFESGTRYKILEAAATRIPIVSTALGAEGIPLVHNQGIFITDDPKKFAEYTLRLIRDKALAERIAENAYSLISRNYSVNALTDEAGIILKYLINSDKKIKGD